MKSLFRYKASTQISRKVGIRSFVGNSSSGAQFLGCFRILLGVREVYEDMCVSKLLESVIIKKLKLTISYICR